MSWELRLDASERKRERELLDQKQEEFDADMRALVAMPEGRRFLHWLVEQGDIYRKDYVPGMHGAYAAGKRAAALELCQRLRNCLAREDFLDIVLPALEDGQA